MIKNVQKKKRVERVDWSHHSEVNSFGAGSCVQSAAVRDNIQADMLESLGFITILLPDNNREFSAFYTPTHIQRDRLVGGGMRE